jgi:hypothetical protein
MLFCAVVSPAKRNFLPGALRKNRLALKLTDTMGKPANCTKFISTPNQRIEGSEWHPDSGHTWRRGAHPSQIDPVIIRVKAAAGQAGLERVAEFARAKGLGLVKMSVEERSVVVCGTVGQMSEMFAVNIGIYESSTERYRGCHGHLHLPKGLAEIPVRDIDTTMAFYRDVLRTSTVDE